MLEAGYFECLSPVIVGAAPAGLHGNLSGVPMPVHGPCGHLYQAAPVSGGSMCLCGMFAIGKCQTCGLERCGIHGTHNAEGVFVCAEHIAEARATAVRQSEDAAREAARRREEEQSRALADLLATSLPGLRPDARAGPDLAAALSEHAGSWKERLRIFGFTTGRPKAKKAQGWWFTVGSRFDRESYTPKRKVWILVTTEGHVYRAETGDVDSPPRSIDTPLSAQYMSEVTDSQLECIAQQVLRWKGERPS
ncbi:hypothetical protein [Miltoncostaea oceani]|uniref:hypothetical protein n=1 Tax=Miltoncostaea oceani TaxID=2843216 RepID=UPI001C3C844D|nr:hypothetical protein [Miltoncostaea oceani]